MATMTSEAECRPPFFRLDILYHRLAFEATNVVAHVHVHALGLEVSREP